MKIPWKELKTRILVSISVTR